MTSIPKFSAFKAGITEEKLKELEVKSNTRVEKFFKPGNYDLKIVDAKLHKMSEADPTWMVVAVDLGGIDERKLKTFIMVPTESIRYNKPGIKDPLVLTYSLRKFLTAIGESSIVDEFETTLPKLFAEPAEGLVGKVLNVDIGYKGYYVDYVGDKQYKIFEKSGKEFKPEGGESVPYPDRDSAIADAANYGIAVSRFVEVLKFNAPEDTDEDTTF